MNESAHYLGWTQAGGSEEDYPGDPLEELMLLAKELEAVDKWDSTVPCTACKEPVLMHSEIFRKKWPIVELHSNYVCPNCWTKLSQMISVDEAKVKMGKK